MRKTRLVILPGVRSITQIGCLLLFLACPTIAFKGQERRDTEPICKFHEIKYWWLPFDTGEGRDTLQKWTGFQQCQKEEFREMIKVRNKTDYTQKLRNENATVELLNPKTMGNFVERKIFTLSLPFIFGTTKMKRQSLRIPEKQVISNTSAPKTWEQKKILVLFRNKKETLYQYNTRNNALHFNYVFQKNTGFRAGKSRLQRELSVADNVTSNTRRSVLSDERRLTSTERISYELNRFQRDLRKRSELDNNERSTFDKRHNVVSAKLTETRRICEKRIRNQRESSFLERRTPNRRQSVVDAERRFTITENMLFKKDELRRNIRDRRERHVDDQLTADRRASLFFYERRFTILIISTYELKRVPKTLNELDRKELSNEDKRRSNRKLSVEHKRAQTERRTTDMCEVYNNIRNLGEPSDSQPLISDRSRHFVVSAEQKFTQNVRKTFEGDGIHVYIRNQRAPSDLEPRKSERRRTVVTAERKETRIERQTIRKDELHSNIRNGRETSRLKPSISDNSRRSIVSAERRFIPKERKTFAVDGIHVYIRNRRVPSDLESRKSERRRTVVTAERKETRTERQTIEKDELHSNKRNGREISHLKLSISDSSRQSIVSADRKFIPKERKTFLIDIMHINIKNRRAPSNLEPIKSDWRRSVVAAERTGIRTKRKTLEMNGLHSDTRYRMEFYFADQITYDRTWSFIFYERWFTTLERRTLPIKRSILKQGEFSDEDKQRSDRKRSVTSDERRFATPERKTSNCEFKINQRHITNQREPSNTGPIRSIRGRSVELTGTRTERQIFKNDNVHNNFRNQRDSSELESHTPDSRRSVAFGEHRFNTIEKRTLEKDGFYRNNKYQGERYIDDQLISDRRWSVISVKRKISFPARIIYEMKRGQKYIIDRRDLYDKDQQNTSDRMRSTVSVERKGTRVDRRVMEKEELHANIRNREQSDIDPHTSYKRRYVVTADRIGTRTNSRHFEKKGVHSSMRDRKKPSVTYQHTHDRRWSVISDEGRFTSPNRKTLQIKRIQRDFLNRKLSDEDQRICNGQTSNVCAERTGIQTVRQTIEMDILHSNIRNRREPFDLELLVLDSRRSIVLAKRELTIRERKTYEKEGLHSEIRNQRGLSDNEPRTSDSRRSVERTETRTERRTMKKGELHSNKENQREPSKQRKLDTIQSIAFTERRFTNERSSFKNVIRSNIRKRREISDLESWTYTRMLSVVSSKRRFTKNEKKTFEKDTIHIKNRDQRKPSIVEQHTSNRWSVIPDEGRFTTSKTITFMINRVKRDISDQGELSDEGQRRSDRNRYVVSIERSFTTNEWRVIKTDKLHSNIRDRREPLVSDMHQSDKRWSVTFDERRFTSPKKRKLQLKKNQRHITEQREPSDADSRRSISGRLVVSAEHTETQTFGKDEIHSYTTNQRKPSDLKPRTCDKRQSVVSVVPIRTITERRTLEKDGLHINFVNRGEAYQLEPCTSGRRRSLVSAERRFTINDQRLYENNGLRSNIRSRTIPTDLEPPTSNKRRSVVSAERRFATNERRTFKINRIHSIIRDQREPPALESTTSDKRLSVVSAQRRFTTNERRSFEMNRIHSIVGYRREPCDLDLCKSNSRQEKNGLHISNRREASDLEQRTSEGSWSSVSDELRFTTLERKTNDNIKFQSKIREGKHTFRLQIHKPGRRNFIVSAERRVISPERRISETNRVQRYIRAHSVITDKDQYTFDITERRTFHLNGLEKNIRERRLLLVIEKHISYRRQCIASLKCIVDNFGRRTSMVKRLSRYTRAGGYTLGNYLLPFFEARLLLSSEPRLINYDRRALNKGQMESYIVLRQSRINGTGYFDLKRVVYDQNLNTLGHLDAYKNPSQRNMFDRKYLTKNEYQMDRGKNTVKQHTPSGARSGVTYADSEMQVNKADQQGPTVKNDVLSFLSLIGKTFSTLNLAVITSNAMNYLNVKNSVFFPPAKYVGDVIYRIQQLTKSWFDRKLKIDETGLSIQTLLPGSVFASFAITSISNKRRVYWNLISIF